MLQLSKELVLRKEKCLRKSYSLYSSHCASNPRYILRIIPY